MKKMIICLGITCMVVAAGSMYYRPACYARQPVNADSTMLVKAALPVHEDWIPDEVTNKLNGMYGADLYDITRIKCTNGNDGYVVRTLKNRNGMEQTTLVDANGNATQR